MSRKKGFEQNPIVGIAMGSESDLTVMQQAAITLEQFEVPHEVRVISAHRTPDKMAKYGKEAVRRGLRIVIAGAGGSAHLPGELASHSRIPVLGVAIESSPDPLQAALGSMARMPKGVPLAFMGINEAGAVNAALESVRILGMTDKKYAEAYDEYMKNMAEGVEETDEQIRTQGFKAFLRNRRLAQDERLYG